MTETESKRGIVIVEKKVYRKRMKEGEGESAEGKGKGEGETEGGARGGEGREARARSRCQKGIKDVQSMHEDKVPMGLYVPGVPKTTINAWGDTEKETAVKQG